ncbi:MAG: S-methyl-5'-thioadenosine phosphorylase [Acetobacteraceae bacterium]|nr:S-methyl-5'-thioadenosine phosphorylase [Acetobacteraceae bacterium]
MRLAIVGGSGVCDPSWLDGCREAEIKTPYGPAQLWTGRLAGEEVAFLARHGRGHTLPPHRINYRANVWALRSLGITRVMATSAVGSLHPSLKPGDAVLVDQFLDFTRQRPFTFFDAEGEVVHTDFTEPYCPEVRQAISLAADRLGMEIHRTGCYVCAEGPRYETPAEIRMFQSLGGDVVGMTGLPESVLAREAGLCYALVSTVTNFAAGMSPRPLSHAEVVEVMGRAFQGIRRLLTGALAELPQDRRCGCAGTGAQLTL